MAQQPKKRKRKLKGKVRLKQSMAVVKKGGEKKDTLPRMQAQPPRTVAPVLKVKIKKKYGN